MQCAAYGGKAMSENTKPLPEATTRIAPERISLIFEGDTLCWIGGWPKYTVAEYIRVDDKRAQGDVILVNEADSISKDMEIQRLRVALAVAHEYANCGFVVPAAVLAEWRELSHNKSVADLKAEPEKVGSENKPCPFCGGEVDPEGWLDNEGNRGPECWECGSLAPDMHTWNKRALIKEQSDE
jgi:hypothetical protein